MGLEMVHVSISLEGRVFKETLLPEEGMEYTLSWDGRNVYGQMVYGRAVAMGKGFILRLVHNRVHNCSY